MKFIATLYVMPEAIRIFDIKAKDIDEAYERAIEIAMRKYARVCWRLEFIEVEEVRTCPGK